MHLFVYGTFKRGFSGHQNLATNQFIGEAVLPRFELWDTNKGYPTIIHTSESDEDSNAMVHGEVYLLQDVAKLKELDKLKGVEISWFDRVAVRVHLVGERYTPAWSYACGFELMKWADNFRRIHSGLWQGQTQ